MFPVGYIIMFTEFGSRFLWTTTIFLGLEALITFIILTKLADLLSVVITTAVIFMASWFIEYWGVTTGFPFGSYSYSGILSPHIGGVPLAIMFAWFTLSSCSLLAARFLLKGSSEISAISIASVFILASDVLLEPFAAFVNKFWLWSESAIPMQNFLSWYAIGLIFIFTFSQLIKWHNNADYGSALYKIPVIIMLINISNFAVVNIFNNYVTITVFGLLLFVILILPVILIKNKKHSGSDISPGNNI